ncbi:uncharacterized protein ATNIH1004_008033 [Aspergillus tanneri]|uniref:Uncharacterized protein n=1 Tax=Aspergillus tanneri TaxID=1220188 RepID=A0A5M9MMR7_9EURO|nr:uncharacterized protein ATNIH1004_008033 [Aspergillus tanneri]KAA8646600.1 hypothetical protein ATNIH1004_008033 [Aspergillus tanneri]
MELILVNTLSEQVNNCVIQDMLKYPDEGAIVLKQGQYCLLVDDSDSHFQFDNMRSEYEGSNRDFCNSIVNGQHELRACGKAFNAAKES